MFTVDKTAVRSFGGGRIKTTGFHAFTITKAYERDSLSSASKALHLDVVTDSGESGQIDLWYQGKDGTSNDKNGNPLSALVSINDLMVVSELDNLKAKPAMVDIYDFELKKDVKTKKIAYADLVGKHIGGVFQMVRDGKRAQVNGEWKASTTEFIDRAEFKCFTSDTGQSAKEFLDGAKPVSIAKYVEAMGKFQPSTPEPELQLKPASVNADFSDDIPW